MNYVARTMTAAPAISLAEEKAFRLGALLVRPSTREIFFDGRSEIVEPRVMQVLVVLAQVDGQVVSRDRLIERCWGGRIVGDDAINNCVGKVRGLAALTPEPAFEVETVPRVGYRLIAAEPGDNLGSPQAELNRSQTAAMAVTKQSPSSPKLRLRKMILPAVLGPTVVILAVAFLAGPKLIGRSQTGHTPLPPTQPTAAVLPFTPLYADKNAQIYADEISSDVADTLGHTDIAVISPALSFQFRGDAKARAARALHADLLVDGDVSREGNNLHVAMRVEDVASRLLILSSEIVRPASQAADLPDQVATAIAGALGWEVSIKALTSGRRWPARVRTGILRAVFQCPHRQDPLCAYEAGRQLVSVAPDNAIAQSILAIETTSVLDLLPEPERRPAAARARKAAWTAIRLDPHYGDPYIALSELSLNGPTAAAEAYLRQGLSVEPDSSSLAAFLSAMLYSTGRNEEALAITRKLVARDKFQDWSYTNQIWALLGRGRAADALEIAKRARRLWPDTQLFVLMLFDATAFGATPADAEALLKDPVMGPILHSPGEPPTVVDLARALRTRRAQDIVALAHDCASDPRKWLRMHFCLPALAEFGRIDEAFKLPPADGADLVLFWPQTAPLRADPRFESWIEKLGLLAYWRGTHSRPDFCATEHVPVCQALSNSR